MCAAVRQAEYGLASSVSIVWMISRLSSFSDNREEQEPFCVGGEVVIGDFVGGMVRPSGDGRDAFVFLRLVIRWVAHGEHTVPTGDDMLAKLREAVQQRLRWRLGQDLSPHAGSCIRVIRSATGSRNKA